MLILAIRRKYDRINSGGKDVMCRSKAAAGTIRRLILTPGLMFLRNDAERLA
jgi:hypothetical protein